MRHREENKRYFCLLNSGSSKKQYGVAYVNRQWYCISGYSAEAVHEAYMTIGTNPPAKFPPPPIPKKKKLTKKKAMIVPITEERVRTLLASDKNRYMSSNFRNNYKSSSEKRRQCIEKYNELSQVKKEL